MIFVSAKTTPLRPNLKGAIFYAIPNKTLTYCKQYDII